VRVENGDRAKPLQLSHRSSQSTETRRDEHFGATNTTDEDDGAITPAVLPLERMVVIDASGDESDAQLGARGGERVREEAEPPPSVLTVDELAALLRVNRKTVYEALSRGEIPGARRIGATYRILRDAVLEWLASGQERAARSRRFR
jgi:excisionase family DNA binding protein